MYSNTQPYQGQQPTTQRTNRTLNDRSHFPKPSFSPHTQSMSYPTPFVNNPPQGHSKLTTSLWEDEDTLCYQVDVRGVCVARRQDNDMINGTKLLNITKMSRGKRDGILKNIKGRVVVKVGAMHFKGVWISLVRAKALAVQFRIADVLRPLLIDNPLQYFYPLNIHSIGFGMPSFSQVTPLPERDTPTTSQFNKRTLIPLPHAPSVPSMMSQQPVQQAPPYMYIPNSSTSNQSFRAYFHPDIRHPYGSAASNISNLEFNNSSVTNTHDHSPILSFTTNLSSSSLPHQPSPQEQFRFSPYPTSTAGGQQIQFQKLTKYSPSCLSSNSTMSSPATPYEQSISYNNDSLDTLQSVLLPCRYNQQPVAAEYVPSGSFRVNDVAPDNHASPQQCIQPNPHSPSLPMIHNLSLR